MRADQTFCGPLDSGAGGETPCLPKQGELSSSASEEAWKTPLCRPLPQDSREFYAQPPQITA